MNGTGGLRFRLASLCLWQEEALLTQHEGLTTPKEVVPEEKAPALGHIMGRTRTLAQWRWLFW
jgi:hypothetical protein